MKIYNCIQGTSEWLALRAGIPTASQFDKILTPGGKPSKSAETYMFSLLAERMMGRPILQHVSFWMDRGAQMEEEAVQFYEFQRDCETVKVGFVTTEDGTIGASPDRTVGTEGLLEIKVPAEHIHVSYLLKKAVDQAYYPQVQGQLWVSERKWVDILSYHPEMPPALIRVERDEAFIALLSAAVMEFSLELEKLAADLVIRGWIIPREPVTTVPPLPTQPQAQEQPQTAVAETGGEPVSPKFTDWIAEMGRAKAVLGEQLYYEVLTSFGYQHANAVKTLASQKNVRQAMKTALANLKHVPPTQAPSTVQAAEAAARVPAASQVIDEFTDRILATADTLRMDFSSLDRYLRREGATSADIEIRLRAVQAGDAFKVKEAIKKTLQ